MSTLGAAAGAWTRAERLRLSGVAGVVAALHVAGWSLYFYYTNNLVGAATFAAAGTGAYGLGIRHAFDADHIAAIDDTTRLMVQRGKRPVGVGFFFSLGHSTVVLVLALLVALAAGAATESGVASLREVGGLVATVVAMSFLLLVAALNAMVLAGVVRLWRGFSRGRLDARDLESRMVNQGLMNRMLGGRTRALVRSSWHMFPVGLLFGLGLETASEVALLGLAATTASAGALPALAVLTLPLLFAAGMSGIDTMDGLFMSRAYSWAFRNPARRLYYNIATTGMTVLVAAFVGSVYLAGLLVERLGLSGPLAGYAGLATRFQLLGFVIVGAFLAAWLGAAVLWRLGGFERRYGAPSGEGSATDERGEGPG